MNKGRSPALDIMSKRELDFTVFANDVFAELRKDEELSLSMNAEDSTFVRFNGAKIRQAGTVEQGNLAFHFLKNGRSVEASIPFSFDLEKDRAKSVGLLHSLREMAENLPEDPYFSPLQSKTFSSANNDCQLPKSSDLIDLILPHLQGGDAAGLMSSGPLFRACFTSRGARHWFATGISSVDYSFYTKEHKAVKGSYASPSFNEAEFKAKIEDSKQKLAMLARPSREIPRGKYRTYFTPAAITEMLHILSWGGFSGNAIESGVSPLRKLAKDGKLLSSKLNITEDFSLGLAPRFNSRGELMPEKVELISEGKLKNLLVSEKTSKEYKLVSNNASASESPSSLVLKGGTLAEKDILKTLGTGLYLGNLHYLNYSDVQEGRITGMTRYACFWVENGEIVSPIKDLRFDDSVYNFLSEKQLLGLTQNPEIILSESTYEARQVGGLRTPGMLIDDFTYTL